MSAGPHHVSGGGPAGGACEADAQVQAAVGRRARAGSPRGKRGRGLLPHAKKIDHECEQERRSDGRCAEQTRRIGDARVQQGVTTGP
jgi:hypothetical protein